MRLDHFQRLCESTGSVLFLVDEKGELEILKDKEMLRRLNDVNQLSDADKHHVLYTFDVMLRYSKAKSAYK